MDKKAVYFPRFVCLRLADLKLSFCKPIHRSCQGKDGPDYMPVHQNNHQKNKNHINTGQYKNTHSHRLEIRKERIYRNNYQLDPFCFIRLGISDQTIFSLYLFGEISCFFRKSHTFYMKILIQTAAVR